MKLGILVNTDRHLDAVVGLARAAVGKGHEVIVFAMEDGTRLLGAPAYVAISALPAVTMGFCHESAARAGVSIEGLPDDVNCGSQLQNAMMVHNADRVVVL